jgi:hypothetical protein
MNRNDLPREPHGKMANTVLASIRMQLSPTLAQDPVAARNANPSPLFPARKNPTILAHRIAGESNQTNELPARGESVKIRVMHDGTS